MLDPGFIQRPDPLLLASWFRETVGGYGKV
jgi:hypothetical protein